MAVEEQLRSYGDRIRRKRLSLDSDGNPIRGRKHVTPMSREQLGSLLDPPVDRTTIFRWENGIVEPRGRNRDQIEQILGVTMRATTKAVA